MENKIFLGRVKHEADNMLAGENVYLTKHTWDCEWYWGMGYWGMGYIGNSQTHSHFDSVFLKDSKTASELFINPKFTDGEWWIIRDLMIQAYALKHAAEVYKYGGHQPTARDTTDKIENPAMVELLNKDLKTVLDTLWDYMTRESRAKIDILQRKVKTIENDMMDKKREYEKVKHELETIAGEYQSTIKELERVQ